MLQIIHVSYTANLVSCVNFIGPSTMSVPILMVCQRKTAAQSSVTLHTNPFHPPMDVLQVAFIGEFRLVDRFATSTFQVYAALGLFFAMQPLDVVVKRGFNLEIVPALRADYVSFTFVSKSNMPAQIGRICVCLLALLTGVRSVNLLPSIRDGGTFPSPRFRWLTVQEKEGIN